ncbi:MAG: hypothetical protein KBD63_01980 [Bacteriovoracaceae bacterium]|nr:hypothetical protein [Bacteriovoracaceae bacterium]
MKQKIISFLKDESGQTSTEYILLLAVAAMIVFKFRSVAMDKINVLVNSVFDKAGSILEETTTQ